MNPNDIIIISWYHIISSYNIIHHLPSGKLTVCDIEHGPVEIVGFPIIARVIFHGFWNVYQRLNPYFPYLPEVKSICSTKNGDFPYVVIPIIPLFNPKTLMANNSIPSGGPTRSAEWPRPGPICSAPQANFDRFWWLWAQKKTIPYRHIYILYLILHIYKYMCVYICIYIYTYVYI